MKRLCQALICLMAPSVALAANQYAVAKRVEASMVVTGSIILNPNGSVSSYALDKQNELPSPVVEIISKTVPSWKFQPISILDSRNNPELVKAAMNLRVVAHPKGESTYELSVQGASFGKDNEKSSDSVTYKDRSPPPYPFEALQQGVSGIVYLVLRIGRDGHVGSAVAEEVDLRITASDAQMDAWRRELAKPAIAAAQKWTFNVPQTREGALADHWIVRVPVNFTLLYGGISPQEEYGQWDAYVPGPVNQVPWAQESDKQLANGGADAIPDNGTPFQNDPRLVLLDQPGSG